MKNTAPNLPEVATVEFQGAQLIVIKKDDIEFVAMKPISEGIGLNWQKQYEKLQRNKEQFSCTLMGIAGKDGKQYSMLCMPINKLNGWLFTINPNKVPNLQTREKVIRYQEECFNALYNYWHNGKAERAVVKPTGKQAIERINRIKSRLIWDNIWAIALRKGMNMTELAKATNISPGDLNKYKNGKNIGTELFARFVEALGVEPEALLSGSSESVTEDGVLYADGQRIKLCSEEIVAAKLLKLLNPRQKLQMVINIATMSKEFAEERKFF